uniref:FH2 domain-containing protein n=1 Tax=Angiostrongylus cantonensis TaxID=6313 RepID=A0A0K0DR13_ANGCA
MTKKKSNLHGLGEVLQRRPYILQANYDEEEVEALYMDLEKFHREDHTFFKVIIGDFSAKIESRRTSH